MDEREQKLPKWAQELLECAARGQHMTASEIVKVLETFGFDSPVS